MPDSLANGVSSSTNAPWAVKDVGRKSICDGEKKLTRVVGYLRLRSGTDHDSSIRRMVSVVGGILLLPVEGLLQS